MQHPKTFYTTTAPPEGFSPRGLDRADGPPCPEPLPSAGGPVSLYHPPNPEKEAYPAPPAGFQMAPCGCFFDPRIYRIEWATPDFGQASLYKLGGGGPAGAPSSAGGYILEAPPPYLKSAVPPAYLPPPPPTTTPATPQYLVPYFLPEGAGPEGLGFPVGDGGPPAAAFVEVPPALLKEGPGAPAPPKDPKPPPVVVSLPAETPFPQGGYGHPKGRLGLSQAPLPPLPAATKDSQGFGGAGSAGPPCPPQAESKPGGAPSRPTLGAGESKAFVLPEKILLEDAMKLFDCLPPPGAPEAQPEGRPPPKPPGPGGDIRCLHLPDELLSLDYNVPEILDAVSHVDCLFHLPALDEGTPVPAARPPSAAPPARKKAAPKKGRQGARARLATAVPTPH